MKKKNNGERKAAKLKGEAEASAKIMIIAIRKRNLATNNGNNGAARTLAKALL